MLESEFQEIVSDDVPPQVMCPKHGPTYNYIVFHDAPTPRGTERFCVNCLYEVLSDHVEVVEVIA